MRQAAKTLGIILLVLGSVWIYGCGSGSDLLDEQNSRYTASLSVDDQTDTEFSIDIAQDDCDLNATTTGDTEDYFPAIGEITVTVGADAPGITLQSYEIEYIPRLSEDGTHNLVMPPVLDDPLPASYNVYIPTASTVVFSLTAISVDTKEEYRNLTGWTLFFDAVTGALYWVPPNLDEARYTVRFTLHFKDENSEDRTITVEQTVWFGDFDNC